MMAELKTLKELQKDLHWEFDTYNGLQEEARKWLKEFDDETSNIYKATSLKEWVKYFFNLDDKICKRFLKMKNIDEDKEICDECRHHLIKSTKEEVRKILKGDE